MLRLNRSILHRINSFRSSIKFNPSKASVHKHLSTQIKSPISFKSKFKLTAVGLAAAMTQATIGVGHGIVVNFGAKSILQQYKMRQVVGTASWAFLGTGTAMLACFINIDQDEEDDEEENKEVKAKTDRFLLNDETVFTSVCLGAPGILTTPIGVMIGKKIPNKMLIAIVGAALLCFSPLILQSAWKSYNKDGFTTQPSSSSPLSSSSPSMPSSSPSITFQGLHRGFHRVLKSFLNASERAMVDPMLTARHIVTGSVAGVLYGLAGTGPVLMTYLAVTTDLSHPECVATGMLAHYPRVLVGLVMHTSLGNVIWQGVPFLLAGTCFGGYFGSNILTSMPEAPLKAVFGTMVGIFGFRQVMGVFKRVKL